MIGHTSESIVSLQHDIARNGFATVSAAVMRELLNAVGPLSDWERFAASWNDLRLDTYMADGGRYRRRRHAVYATESAGRIVRQPHRPHYQSRDYNRLNGGIARWFEPVDRDLGEGPTMAAILQLCRITFGSLVSADRWLIEVHQFRIEARPNEQGRPTPEGIHRDGVDYVLVLLVARHNIKRGTTTIHDNEGRPLGSFTLTAPFEAVLLDDTRVYHGVTPVEPLDPNTEAYRDVLVVTWNRLTATPVPY
jgi:hypothetical protein